VDPLQPTFDDAAQNETSLRRAVELIDQGQGMVQRGVFMLHSLMHEGTVAEADPITLAKAVAALLEVNKKK